VLFGSPRLDVWIGCHRRLNVIPPVTTTKMHISERPFGSAIVLEVHGAVIGSEAGQRLGDAVIRHARADRPIVVVNLGRVPQIDLVGVCALVLADRAVQRVGARLRVALASDRRSRHQLLWARLTALFDTFESVEDALSDVRRSMDGDRRWRLGIFSQPTWLAGTRRLLSLL